MIWFYEFDFPVRRAKREHILQSHSGVVALPWRIVSKAFDVLCWRRRLRNGAEVEWSAALCVRIFKINVLPWLLASPFMYLRALGSVYYLVIWQSAFICGLNFLFCTIRSLLWRLELANWRGGELKVNHLFSCNWREWNVIDSGATLLRTRREGHLYFSLLLKQLKCYR